MPKSDTGMLMNIPVLKHLNPLCSLLKPISTNSAQLSIYIEVVLETLDNTRFPLGCYAIDFREGHEATYFFYVFG